MGMFPTVALIMFIRNFYQLYQFLSTSNMSWENLLKKKLLSLLSTNLLVPVFLQLSSLLLLGQNLSDRNNSGPSETEILHSQVLTLVPETEY